MKILMVSFTFPPNKDGISEAASAIVGGYLNQGWKVDVLTETLTTPRTEPLEWNGAKIIEYQQAKGGTLVLNNNTHGRVVDFLLNGDWDLIMFHAYDKVLHAVLPMMEQVSGKKVLVSHGYPGFIWNRVSKFPYGLTHMFRRCLKGLKMVRWMRKLDRIVYLSDHADLKGFYDHWLAKASGYPGRVVIANGVDPSDKARDPQGFRQRHNLPDDAFVFLCVANYSPRKDQAYAARAFRRAGIPNSRLVFIGSVFNKHSDGFMAQERSMARPGEEDHVMWLEKQTRDETLDAFAACDTFVLSASHEAQPISLLEAMRESKPWIARRSGCIQTMEGGICVGSERRMTEAMWRIASDPSERAKLAAEGAAAVITKYNRDSYLRSYCNLARELCIKSSD